MGSLPSVRLRPEEVEAITDAAAKAFGETCVVRLFGSRVRPDVRGGDIDLHMEVEEPVAASALSRFEDHLFERIDPQRIDVIVSVRGRERSPIAQMAYRDGVILP